MTSYETIFVGFDFASLSDLALETAGRVARYFDAKRIHVVHVARFDPGWVLGPNGMGAPYDTGPYYSVLRREVENVAVPVDAAQVTREMRIGAVSEQLVASAQDNRADLMVIASHRRGRVGRFVLGSVASTLVRAAPCPVLVVGEDRPWRAPVNNVLAAIDGTRISSRVLAHAARFAARENGKLQVVSVFDLDWLLRARPDVREPPVREMIELCESGYRDNIEDIARRAEYPGVAARVDVVLHDKPREAILEAAHRDRADLLVLGTSGHNAWQRMVLGSTATHVLAEAPCPVLVVPSADGS